MADARMWCAARSRSASLSTSAGFRPPSSSATAFAPRLAAPATARPAAVEPVKCTASTPGCEASACAAPAAPKSATSTSGGKPASRSAPRAAAATPLARSDGFQTTVFPATRAGSHFQAGVSNGTFQGVIVATTPRGRHRTSALPARSSRGGCVAYQRAEVAVQSTSAAASVTGLPTSSTIERTSSCRRASTTSAKRSSVAQRSASGRPDHAASAVRARPTACSTSAALAPGSVVVMAPVAGLRPVTVSGHCGSVRPVPRLGRAPPFGEVPARLGAGAALIGACEPARPGGRRSTGGSARSRARRG